MMTRKEAKISLVDLVNEILEQPNKKSKTINLTMIDKIYDDFENKTCEWKIIDDDDMDEDSYKALNVWFSDCKYDWRLPADETPKQNGMNYCPKCGGKIKIKGEIRQCN
jgi:hypothetical protein